MTLADTAHGSDWILWGVIAILLLITGLFESFLPSSFVYVLLVLIVIDVVIIIILRNTICKK